MTPAMQRPGRMGIAVAATAPPFAAGVQPALAALGAAAWLAAGMGATLGLRWLRRRRS
jgi:hypothetical protein